MPRTSSHSFRSTQLRNLAAAVGLAALLALTTTLPVAGALEPTAPEPLRRAQKLRAQDIEARADVVALGWREGGQPDQLYLGLSRDGGASFLRGSGRLRKFPLAGLAGRGLSLALCGRGDVRSVWAVTAVRARNDRAGDADVLLTRRGLARPARDAGQLFITTPTAKRQVREADVACVGDHHLAIAWLEKKDGRVRARLAIRRLRRTGQSRPVRAYNLGPAQMRGGIAVAATPDAVHVVWTKNDRQHLRYERFAVRDRKASRFERGMARGLAWRDVERPVLTARGRKVVAAYSDAGDLKVKWSDDAGATFGSAQRVASGTPRAPARARSIALSGRRVVIAAIDRSSGSRVPTRIESADLGGSWSRLVFGNDGVRLAALEKIDYSRSRLKVLLHDDGTRVDTLRARHEVP